MSAPNVRDIGVQKGNITIGGQGGGELLPAQAQEYINLIHIQPSFLADVEMKTMYTPQERIERAGYNSRISHPDIPGQPTDPSKKADLYRSKALLDAKWFKAMSEIDYKVENENIMRLGIQTYVRDEMVRQGTLDMEESVILGDTESEDDDMVPFDGIIKQADAHMVNPQTPVPVTDDVFYELRNALPKGFLRDLPNMRYYCSSRVESAYAMYLKHHSNPIGNFILLSQGQDTQDRLEFLGVPLRRVDLFPDNVILLTHRLNIRVGVFITMYLENQRFIDPGVDQYVLRYACDVKYIHPEGVAVHKAVTTGIFPTD